MNDTEAPDKVDAAIEKTQPDPSDSHFIANFRFETGETMKLIVPITFTSDQFETAVNLLTQIRARAEELRRMREGPKIVLPDKPKLQTIDGRRLT